MDNFTLVDDGTMDTVIACDNCGKETRFNFDPTHSESYEEFVEWCMNELKNDHECEEEDD